MTKIMLGNKIVEVADFQPASEPLTHEQSKPVATSRLKEIRTNRAYGGYSFEGNNYGRDALDSQNISSAGFAITTSVMSMEQATGGYWKNTSGDKITLTKEKFLSMASGLALFQLANLREYHSQKEAIELSENINQVNDIIKQYENFNPME